MLLFDNPDLAYCEISGTLIFLDIARDRYFCLSERHNREALALIDEQGLGRQHQPGADIKSIAFEAPVRSSTAIVTGPFRIADTARAIWIQRRVEKRIASWSFHSMLSDLRTVLDTCTVPEFEMGRDAARTIRAFEYARLLRTAADRCLPRSIALALCLASDGMRANVVVGVRLAPFGAHCWVQQGGDVLNDSVEEVLCYRPILVI